MAKKSRIFNIMQYEKHPDTGEVIMWCDADGNVLKDKEGNPIDFGLNEEKIEHALEFKSWKRWAYVLHDKDTYTKDDEEGNPDHKAGALKPPHWHIVAESDNALELQTVAKWFGIPMQFIDVPKGGRRAFLDCVEYLTHESANAQAQGKALYMDAEVEANFDFHKELDERSERMVNGQDIKRRDYLRLKVQRGELTIREMKKDIELAIAYFNDRQALEAARKIYVNKFAPMPPFHINFYITGASGEGKSTLTRRIARSLFPHIENDDEIFFIVGADNVSFEGYDAQPVVIWDDFRADTLLDACGNRGNLFKVFEPYPSEGAGGLQHIKHDAIRLVNAINIVNGIQPWEEFLNGLVSAYVDKKGRKVKGEDAQQAQANRRFPIIIPVDGDAFSILLNKGVMEGSREFLQYYCWQRINGNFGKLAHFCDRNSDAYKIAEVKMMAPVLAAHSEVQKAMTAPKEVPAEFWEELQDYGKPVAVVETEKKLKALRGVIGDDPDTFIEAHGIMNISSPELRSLVLSIIHNDIVSAEGEVISNVGDAAEFLSHASDEELAALDEVLNSPPVDWEAATKAMRAQMFEGIVCPENIKTDKGAAEYVLPRLRMQLEKASADNAPKIREAIERLEACGYDENGKMLPFKSDPVSH